MPQRKTKPKTKIHKDYKVLQEAARIGDIATINAQIPFLQQGHPEDNDLLQQLEEAANNFDIDQIQKHLSI